MATPGTVTKSMLETRNYPLAMAALIAQGATLESVQYFASRTTPYPLQSTTLAAPIVVGDTTIHLTADPKAGALLIIEPGAGAEERLKVISTTPHTGHFDATVIPMTWAAHSNGAAVSYEPGVSARCLVDDTPTPSGTNVSVAFRYGAHGQTYRVSAHGVANDTQEVEDEFLVAVADLTPTVTNIKQPTEMRDLAGDFTLRLAEAHQNPGTTTISSAVAYVNDHLTSTTTTLAAQATAEDTTISLVAHPGIGAMLILTPAGSGANPPERVYVSNVSGGGPYTVTITPPVEFTHTNGADVTVFGGVSVNFLVSASSTISGLEAINRAKGGQHGKQFKVTWVATTSQGEVLTTNGLVSTTEL